MHSLHCSVYDWELTGSLCAINAYSSVWLLKSSTTLPKATLLPRSRSFKRSSAQLCMQQPTGQQTAGLFLPILSTRQWKCRWWPSSCLSSLPDESSTTNACARGWGIHGCRNTLQPADERIDTAYIPPFSSLAILYIFSVLLSSLVSSFTSSRTISFIK